MDCDRKIDDNVAQIAHLLSMDAGMLQARLENDPSLKDALFAVEHGASEYKLAVFLPEAFDKDDVSGVFCRRYKDFTSCKEDIERFFAGESLQDGNDLSAWGGGYPDELVMAVGQRYAPWYEDGEHDSGQMKKMLREAQDAEVALDFKDSDREGMDTMMIVQGYGPNTRVVHYTHEEMSKILNTCLGEKILEQPAMVEQGYYAWTMEEIIHEALREAFVRM